jgi:hypothetical protein
LQYISIYERHSDECGLEPPGGKKNTSKQPCARMMMNPKRTDHLAETVEATGTKSFQIRNRCRTGKRLDHKRCLDYRLHVGSIMIIKISPIVAIENV